MIRWDQVRRQGRKELELWGLEVDIGRRAGGPLDRPAANAGNCPLAAAGRRFIILDEPTARLEAREIEQLFEHIKELKRAGVTFLFISHYLEEIYEICERVAVLRDGRLVAEAAIRARRRLNSSPPWSARPISPWDRRVRALQARSLMIWSIVRSCSRSIRSRLKGWFIGCRSRSASESGWALPALRTPASRSSRRSSSGSASQRKAGL